jgi:peroxiredoxin
VQVSGRLGRKRTVWVDVERPIVVAFEERVFVGQGDEHALTLQIESQKSLLPEQRDRDQRVIDRLLALQKALDRPDNEFRAELNAAQLKLASEALPELRQLANDTPFSALVTAISRDVDAQAMRNSEVARLADRFVGQQAPEFSLTLLDKTQVTREKLNGRLVVLHFWDYQGEPLVEPYGQVGYLDFLYGRRRKLGVDVFGVAVDSRLKDEQSAPAAIKSFQRLREFMKLSYPLAADDGGLLAKFGDPPKFGARLPLWVVIDEAGRIVHYHSGYYKINPDEGLRDLDDVLVNAIRARQTGSGKPGE